MKEDDALLNFLFDEVGGKEQALLLYHRRQVAELASLDKSLKDTLAVAQEEGWREWLLGIRMTDLANLVNPVEEARASRGAGKVAARGAPGRMTAKQRDDLFDRIVEVVRDNPGSAASDIADVVGMDARKVGQYLSKLKKQGRLTAQGERINTRYSVPTGEEKPFAPAKRRR